MAVGNKFSQIDNKKREAKLPFDSLIGVGQIGPVKRFRFFYSSGD
jgi:hypothetical protein